MLGATLVSHVDRSVVYFTAGEPGILVPEFRSASHGEPIANCLKDGYVFWH
jgi:hypothetical protein